MDSANNMSKNSSKEINTKDSTSILDSEFTKGQKLTNKEDHIRYYIWNCKIYALLKRVRIMQKAPDRV